MLDKISGFFFLAIVGAALVSSRIWFSDLIWGLVSTTQFVPFFAYAFVILNAVKLANP